MRNLIVPAIFLTLFSASSNANQPSYTFVQASFVKTELADLENFDPTGFELKVSAEVGYDVFVEYKYTNADDTSGGLKLDTKQQQFSMGYIHNISAKTTFDYRIGYGNFKMTGSSVTESTSASIDYFSLAANVRYQLTPELEIFGGLEAQNWDGDADQKAYRLGAQYNLWGFLTGVEYTKYSDQEIFGVSARYVF